MKNIFYKLIYIFIIILLIVGGYYYKTKKQFNNEKQNESINTVNNEKQTETNLNTRYENPKLRMSFNANPNLFSVSEDVKEDGTGSVTLADTSDGHWLFSVDVQKTSFKNTKEWLNAQTKSSGSSEGYKVEKWIDSDVSGENDWVILARYVVSDINLDGTSVYESMQTVVRVDKDGTLYQASSFGINESDFASPGEIQFYLDFKSGSEYIKS